MDNLWKTIYFVPWKGKNFENVPIKSPKNAFKNMTQYSQTKFKIQNLSKFRKSKKTIQFYNKNRKD